MCICTVIWNLPKLGIEIGLRTGNLWDHHIPAAAAFTATPSYVHNHPHLNNRGGESNDKEKSG